MAPAPGQGSLVTEGILFYFGFSSAVLLLRTDTSLHDLVTPLLGLLALTSKESQAGRGGLETRREPGRQEAEPVAESARCKAIIGAAGERGHSVVCTSG